VSRGRGSRRLTAAVILFLDGDAKDWDVIIIVILNESSSAEDLTISSPDRGRKLPWAEKVCQWLGRH
jgi:hypothetical protein